MTDCNMPGKSGLELIHQVRGRGNDVPILAYSASGKEREMLAAGANRFLSKPAPLAQLQQTVTQLLREREVSPSGCGQTSGPGS